MSMNPEATSHSNPEHPKELALSPQEKNRLIAHLGRVYSRRYDIQVLPSHERGVWATGLDPETNIELEKYMTGQRDSLDDLPPDAFIPKKILYDAESAQGMSMDQISTILHHEAGHAKYTDFRLMMEGQKQAKDEGYLPTSFWLMFEGIEDPRVNSLEGEESPAIDRQIRTNQGKDLEERITETPLSSRPLLLQFAYNSSHYWLHGKGIPELEDTDVGRLGEVAKPLLEQYFLNTDVDIRRLLQKQIWDIAKELEKKDIEDEEKRQMAERKQRSKQQQEEGQSGEGQSGTPNIPGGGEPRQNAASAQGSKRFIDRLKQAILGRPNQSTSNNSDSGFESDSSEVGGEAGHQISKPSFEKKPERFDLSKLSDEELQDIKDAIDQLPPEERAELTKVARITVDEIQKAALEEELGKTMKLERNKKTGEYEIRPQTVDEKAQKQAEHDYKEALSEVEAEEQAEYEREEAERRHQEGLLKQLEQARKEKIEMEKAGFNEDEQDKYLLYQSLEDAMYSYVRNFKQAIGRIIPRRKEPIYEGGYFNGSKLDRRELIRKAPLGDEQFHMRQVEKPTGEPRLFIGLLIDNSGSMQGRKMEEARKATIFFARVCKDMGIPFMATAFGDKAEVIKEFRQDFDDRSQRIKPKLIEATEALGGSTNLHAGIKMTIEAMNEQRRRLRDSHGLILVITDGEANKGLSGDALGDYIKENQGRLTFKGFGLSAGEQERAKIQTYLNLYFGESNCAYPENFEDLPDEAFRLLRINLIQLQRFLS